MGVAGNRAIVVVDDDLVSTAWSLGVVENPEYDSAMAGVDLAADGIANIEAAVVCSSRRCPKGELATL